MIGLFPNRWVLIAACLVSFGSAWKIQGWRWEAERVAQAKTIEAQRLSESEEALAAEQRISLIESENKTLKRRLSHEVKKAAYRCAVPADGVGLLNAARTGK